MSTIIKKIDTDVPKNVRLYGTDTAGGVVPMLTDLSGQLSVEVSVADTLVAKISGEVVTAKVSGETIIAKMSGETVVAKVSGETVVAKTSGEVVIARYDGSVLTIHSGYATSNTLVYSGFGFLTWGRASIHIENLTNGSGLQYTIRGVVESGRTAYTLTSGSVASGQVVVTTISDPYSWVEVGLGNVQTNFSGTATVYVARR